MSTNTGTINSISTVIFLAGDTRYPALASSFLFHGLTSTLRQNSRLNSAQLAERLSRLRQEEEKFAELIADNCNIATDETERLLRQGEAKDLSFALEKGVIQEIRRTNIPCNAKLISVNINVK